MEMYGRTYSYRSPAVQEVGEIAERYASNEFVGCAGAVNCCGIKWKNCPLTVKGHYQNPKDAKLAVIKVEAWCDSELCILHWFPGRPGTTNDKIMVSFSPLFQDIISEK